MSSHDKSNRRLPHEQATTTRPDTPALESGIPLPDELTGRASRTDEGLDTLFANQNADHLADGFRGGSSDDQGSALATDTDTAPDPDEDVAAE